LQHVVVAAVVVVVVVVADVVADVVSQEKNEEKMTCNMLLAELQTKLDKCQNATLAADYQWTTVSRQLSQRTLVLGRITMSVHIYCIYIYTARTYIYRDAKSGTHLIRYARFI